MNKTSITGWVITFILVFIITTGVSFAFYAGLIWFATEMFKTMPGGS